MNVIYVKVDYDFGTGQMDGVHYSVSDETLTLLNEAGCMGEEVVWDSIPESLFSQPVSVDGQMSTLGEEVSNFI